VTREQLEHLLRASASILINSGSRSSTQGDVRYRLLPLVLLVPAGFAVTGLTARLLGGNEVAVALATTRS